MRGLYRIGTAIALLLSIAHWGAAALAGQVTLGRGTILEVLLRTDGAQAAAAAIQLADEAGCLVGITEMLGDPDAKLIVFAPSNPAFETFLRLRRGELDGQTPEQIKNDLRELLIKVELTEADLCDLVLKHVAIAKKGWKRKRLSADGLLARGQITMADGSKFPVSIGNSKAINYETTITEEDIFTDNGVIHFVSNVIRDEPPPSVGAVTVFLTNRQFQGNLGGLAGADEKCREEASWIDLPGTWKAWLSDSSMTAIDRIPAGEYRLLDETLVATDKTDLTDGTLSALINLTVYGTVEADGVWTGTDRTGAGTGSHCEEWTSQVGRGCGGDVTDCATTGANNQSTFGDWTANVESNCSNFFRLYCFGSGQ